MRILPSSEEMTDWPTVKLLFGMLIKQLNSLSSLSVFFNLLITATLK